MTKDVPNVVARSLMAALRLQALKMSQTSLSLKSLTLPQRESPMEQEDELELKRQSVPKYAVDGSVQLYEVGRLKYVPMPTSDPRDPLNLPRRRKQMATIAICLFGSTTFAMQHIMSIMLPAFIDEYAVVGSASSLATASPYTSKVVVFPANDPYWRVSLLIALPFVVAAASSYLLLPLSMVLGRRMVLCSAALATWACLLWAARSSSLTEHLFARCAAAVGFGAMESIAPVMLVELTFLHERAKKLGLFWGSAGIMTGVWGVASLYLTVRLGWRWVYYAFAMVTAISWCFLLISLPETCWERPVAETRGHRGDLPLGIQRPPLDTTRMGDCTDRFMYKPNGGYSIRRGVQSLSHLLKSFLLPSTILIVAITSLTTGLAAISLLYFPSILTSWPELWAADAAGYTFVPLVFSGIFVIIAGILSDTVTNRVSRKQSGQREAEYQIFNMLIPVLCGAAGAVMLGFAGTFPTNVAWVTPLVGMTFVMFSMLALNVAGSVYAVEACPQWAGPILVNTSAPRNLTAFVTLFCGGDWLLNMGYIHLLTIFAGIYGLILFGMILSWRYGGALRYRMRKFTK